MSDNDDLSALAAEMAQHGVFASDEAAVHGWMAAIGTAAMLTLDPGDLLPMDTWLSLNWVMDNIPGPGTDEASAFIDKMGDASKQLLVWLQKTLNEKGMGDAQVFTFYPCHRGYGVVSFSTLFGPAVAAF